MTRRMPLLTLGWILLGLAGTLPLAAADRTQWTPIGPDLSTVRALAVAPSGVAYAGTTERGVFRSSDGGARWSVTGPMPGSQSVRELVIDPGAPRGVYARTENRLFYNRNGNAWREIGPGPISLPYGAFAVAPSEPSRLYLFDGSFLQVSHDRGLNWEALSLHWNDILDLKVHPRDPDTLFASLFSSRVWKSTDGGRSWHETQFIGPTQHFLSVTSLAFDPGNASVMYAGTNSNGIWKSTDAGETWRPIFTVSGLLDSVLALAVDPSQGRRIYAAVDRYVDERPAAGEIWRSEDAGATWTRLLRLPNAVFSLAVDPGNPRNVYAGFERQGVLKSADLGAPGDRPDAACRRTESTTWQWPLAAQARSGSRPPRSARSSRTVPAASSIPASSTRWTVGRAGSLATRGSPPPSPPSGSCSIPCTPSGSGPSALASSTAASTAGGPGNSSSPSATSRPTLS